MEGDGNPGLHRKVFKSYVIRGSTIYYQKKRKQKKKRKKETMGVGGQVHRKKKCQMYLEKWAIRTIQKKITIKQKLSGVKRGDIYCSENLGTMN